MRSLLSRVEYDRAVEAGVFAADAASDSVAPVARPDAWLHDLEQREYFAVRRGVLKFRGWIPKKSPIQATALSDGDFKPRFEQRGVDMRIGLDIANYAQTRAVDVLSLVTNDTDCVPAMKYARRTGLQITLIRLDGCDPAPELLAHSDFRRAVPFP